MLMAPIKKQITWRLVGFSLLHAALFNTFLAFFMTALDPHGGFWLKFWFSQCIGLPICLSVLVWVRLSIDYSALAQFFSVVGGVFSGAILGVLLASWATGLGRHIFEFYRWVGLGQVFLVSVVFGFILSYFFVTKEQIRLTLKANQEERIKRLTLERQISQARLGLLQAQIEPHFLFNTLSNILSLMETDTGAARKSLMDFMAYLRVSLDRSRSELNTLENEMELIRAYLEIFRMRMGDRLRYSIDLPDDLTKINLPPMLVQPLVENAIKHGLEPRVEGGEVNITVRVRNGLLRLEVADTGLGLIGMKPVGGVGLGNVRERLAAIWGGRARLLLLENHPQGLKAVIEAPIEK